MKKSRYICAITYASKDQIQDVIGKHSKSVASYAFILHDKDDCEPHYHLVLKLFSAWDPSQICKWFSLLKDVNGIPVNTLPQVLNDPSSYLEYLTHSDPDSVLAGKHQYPISAIFDCGLLCEKDAKDSRDSSFEIVEKILQGVSVRQLVRLYGRDYVYHYSAYNAVAEAIETEDRYSQFNARKQPVRSWETQNFQEVSTDEPLTIFDKG